MKKVVILLTIIIINCVSVMAQNDNISLETYNKLFEEKIQLKTEYDDLKKQIEELQADKKQIQKKLEKTENQLNKIEKIKEEKDTLERNNKELKKKNEALTNQLQKCTNENDKNKSLQGAYDSIADENAKLKDDTLRMHYQHDANSAEIGRLQARIEGLSKELDAKKHENDSLRAIDPIDNLKAFYSQNPQEICGKISKDILERDKNQFLALNQPVPDVLSQLLIYTDAKRLLFSKFDTEATDKALVALDSPNGMRDTLNYYYFVCDGLKGLLSRINITCCKEAAKKKKDNPGAIDLYQKEALVELVMGIIDIEKMYGGISNYPYANSILQKTIRQIVKDVSDTKAMEGLIAEISPN